MSAQTITTGSLGANVECIMCCLAVLNGMNVFNNAVFKLTPNKQKKEIISFMGGRLVVTLDGL